MRAREPEWERHKDGEGRRTLEWECVTRALCIYDYYSWCVNGYGCHRLAAHSRGVYVCAWERRCCQPAFVCVSAHVSLFKHHTLVIRCWRSYRAEQNIVTLLAHCHIYRANIRPRTCRPHPVTPLSPIHHPPLSAGKDVTAVKDGPPVLEPVRIQRVFLLQMCL